MNVAGELGTRNLFERMKRTRILKTRSLKTRSLKTRSLKTRLLRMRSLRTRMKKSKRTTGGSLQVLLQVRRVSLCGIGLVKAF
jgi:hypothetical protein